MVLIMALLLSVALVTLSRRAVIDTMIIRNRDNAARAEALARGGIRIATGVLMHDAFTTEELAKEFVELYKSKGVDSGWSIYQAITGSDLPLYVVAYPAKSEADYYANREKIREMLGEAGKKIGAKVGATIRRSEYKDGHIRRELSYPAPEPASTR